MCVNFVCARVLCICACACVSACVRGSVRACQRVLNLLELLSFNVQTRKGLAKLFFISLEARHEEKSKEEAEGRAIGPLTSCCRIPALSSSSFLNAGIASLHLFRS